jgi:undecaprenyl-diphosphatase
VDPVIALDVRVCLYLQETFGHGGWLALMSALTVIGSGWGILLLLPLFASPRTRLFAAHLLASIVLTAIVVFSLKEIIHRTRPYLVVPNIHALVFDAPTSPSCPSGHAAGSFTFAMFIGVVMVSHAARASTQRKRRLALAIVMLVAAFGISISRCVLGVHFPLDILLGAVIGSVSGALGARFHLRPPKAIPRT